MRCGDPNCLIEEDHTHGTSTGAVPCNGLLDGEVRKLTDDDFTAHCVLCKTQTRLQMHPHRIGGRMVGWLFACPPCGEKIQGLELHIGGSGHYYPPFNTQGLRKA